MLLNYISGRPEGLGTPPDNFQFFCSLPYLTILVINPGKIQSIEPDLKDSKRFGTR
jgi:hypothetical protein